MAWRRLFVFSTASAALASMRHRLRTIQSRSLLLATSPKNNAEASKSAAASKWRIAMLLAICDFHYQAVRRLTSCGRSIAETISPGPRYIISIRHQRRSFMAASYFSKMHASASSGDRRRAYTAAFQNGIQINKCYSPMLATSVYTYVRHHFIVRKDMKSCLMLIISCSKVRLISTSMIMLIVNSQPAIASFYDKIIIAAPQHLTIRSSTISPPYCIPNNAANTFVKWTRYWNFNRCHFNY